MYIILQSSTVQHSIFSCFLDTQTVPLCRFQNVSVLLVKLLTQCLKIYIILVNIFWMQFQKCRVTSVLPLEWDLVFLVIIGHMVKTYVVSNYETNCSRLCMVTHWLNKSRHIPNYPRPFTSSKILSQKLPLISSL